MAYENKIIKEKNIEYQKNEEKYNNIKSENEKLNQENNDINKEKAQLINELKISKEEYEKLLNERKKALELSVNKPVEINININKELESITSNNNTNDNKIKNKLEENISTIEKISNIENQKINDKKEREKYLKNLFKIKVLEMRDFLHKCFSKFYYNGIFLEMTGKLNHLKKKTRRDRKT